MSKEDDRASIDSFSFFDSSSAVLASANLGRAFEQAKQEEYRVAIEKCVADAQKLKAYNNLNHDGTIENEWYQNLLLTRWLNSLAGASIGQEDGAV